MCRAAAGAGKRAEIHTERGEGESKSCCVFLRTGGAQPKENFSIFEKPREKDGGGTLEMGKLQINGREKLTVEKIDKNGIKKHQFLA